MQEYTFSVCMFTALQNFKINPEADSDSDKTAAHDIHKIEERKHASSKMSSFGDLIILFAPFAVKQHSFQPTTVQRFSNVT